MDWPRWPSVVTNGGLHAQRVWGPYTKEALLAAVVRASRTETTFPMRMPHRRNPGMTVSSGGFRLTYTYAEIYPQ